MKLAVHIPISNNLEQWRIDEAINLWDKQERQADEIIVTNFDDLSNKEDYFSGARCRNVAIKQCKSDYIVFTDVDIRPQSNLLKVIESELEIRPTILMCARLDLPEDSNIAGIDYEKDYEKWARRGQTHSAPGSIQVFSVNWLKKVNGFDERYIGWGYFDCEILRRASMDGWETIWIDSKTSILHVWHEAYAYRTSSEKKNREIYNQDTSIIVNKDKKWGEL